jgi:hypothetical protein
MHCERGLSSFDVRHRFVTSALWDIPVGKGRRLSIENGFLNALIGGWQIGSIVTLQTGFPLTVFAGGDYARNQATGFIRPNATGISPDLPRGQEDPRRFFNEAAFVLQPEGSLGNVSRNTLTGPGLISWDFSSLKDFRIREGHTLQFRFEAFNLPNHPNWGNPNTDIRSGAFNTITSTRTNMRNLQFALKYLF